MPMKEYDISSIEPRWYALHTFSTYENMAKINLEMVFQKNNMQDRLMEIAIPVEDVVEDKNGKRKVVQRKMFPSYIFIKMIFHNDSMWHMIVNTRGVTGFVGPMGRPIPLTEDEISRMKLEKKIVTETNFKVGDKVCIVDGPLGGSGFVGDIESIDVLTNKVKVMVNMFGRVMPVDLELGQIVAIEE